MAVQSTLHLFVNKKVEEVEAADKTNQSVPDGTKPVALAISEGGTERGFQERFHGMTMLTVVSSETAGASCEVTLHCVTIFFGKKTKKTKKGSPISHSAKRKFFKMCRFLSNSLRARKNMLMEAARGKVKE